MSNMSANLVQAELDPTRSAATPGHSPLDVQPSAGPAAAVLIALVQEVANQVAARAGCIYVLDQKRQELEPYAWWSLPYKPVEFTRLALGEGLARLDDGGTDPGGVLAAAGLPPEAGLTVTLHTGEGRVAGVLLVVDKIDGSAFKPEDEQLLAAIAIQPGLILALEKLELDREKQRSAQELAAINQISQALAASLHQVDVTWVCRAVLDGPAFRDLFRFDIAEVCLWDETSQRLTAALRLAGDTGQLQAGPQTYTLNEGYTGWIASRQQVLLIGDLQARVDVAPLVGRSNFPYHAYVGVPIKAGLKFLGTLELAAVSANCYNDRDVAVLESVANQLAIALENARLFSLADQQLQKRADELAAIQRVSRELNSTLVLDRILNLVLEEATSVTQADFGTVKLYDAKNGHLVAHKEQASNNPAVEVISSRREKISDLQGIPGRALRTGRAILVPDVRQEADCSNPDGDISSQVVVPIYYGGEPAGVISLESRQLNFFNNDQLRYLEALSNQAAIAIGNAQAYQEQKLERELASRRADQLAHLSEISNAFRSNRPLHDVLEDIAYAIVESVGYDVVLINLVKGTPPAIYPEVGAGIPVAEFEEFRRSGEIRLLADLQAAMAAEFRLSNSYFIPADRMEVWQGRLSIPYYVEKQGPLPGEVEDRDNLWQSGDLLLTPLLDTEGQTIGLLMGQNPDTNRRPDLSSVHILETFANYATVAIENARLFELEQRRRHLADTLRGVAEAISSQLDFDELLNVVLPALRKVIHYDSASVQLLEEDRLVIIGGHGWEDSQEVLGLSFPMDGANPNRVVVETQEPLMVRDPQAEYPAIFTQAPHNRIRSWLGVPLTYGTNVLGLMAVDSTQPDFFTAEDREVVLAFANQVAVALQNAHLFEEARQQVRQLAALTEVSQALNQALDLNEVLNLVLDAVFDLVGHRKGSIWLIDHSSNTVKIAGTKNVSEVLVELFNESAVSTHTEPFASVIKSGQVLVIAGKAAEKRNTVEGFAPFPDDVTYVPLKTEKGITGILAIEGVISNKNMLDLVTTLADLAAVAMDSARLLEDTRRQASEMQDLYNLGVVVSGMLEVRQVMRSVISSTLALTHTHIGTILLWDEHTQGYITEVASHSRHPVAELILTEIQNMARGEADQSSKIAALWHDLTSQVIETGRPLKAVPPTTTEILPDLNAPARLAASPTAITQVKRVLPLGVRAVLGVPVMIQGQTGGAIFVSSLTPRSFNDHDVQLLSFVANQAAVAVRNAQLVQSLNLLTEELEERVAVRTEELAQTLEELTEERDRVGTLYQITRELSASFDLDRMLLEALSLLNRAVGISYGVIMLLDAESGYLIARATLGHDLPVPRGGYKTRFKLGYGLAGKVMETRQPRIVADILADPDWVVNEQITDRRSAIVVPLSAGDEILGTLLLFHPEVDYFNEDHLKLVTAAGAQIATAINNAELYRLITNQAERLGVMLRTQVAEAAKNQAILNGITDGVLVLDARRHIVLVNPKAAEILNIEPSAVENQPIRQLLGLSSSPVELDLAQKLYDQLLAALPAIEAGSRSAEFRIEAGAKVVVVTLASVPLGIEEVPSIVAVLRDVSREAEIDRIKNEFISTVSHELRTPMTSVKGYADLLASGNPKIGELNPTQLRFVQVIQSNANRLTNLVNDILEISRIETGRVKLDFETLDISKVIREVALSFEGHKVRKPMDLSLDLPEFLPNVYGDKARLVQILVNLIGNAWQYTQQGGRVVVRARVANSHHIQVDVEDNGIGIVEKDLAYIFDRFFRSERPEVQVVDGTGLGLSITRMFVEMLGGKIWVKSQVDVGTIFSFTVPLAPSLIPSQTALLDTSDLQTRPHLLIIDDSSAVVELLTPRLEAEGYQVVTASQEVEAIKIARNASGVLKLIVLDLLLEEGDSFALLEHLAEDEVTARIPVLVSALSVNNNGAGLTIDVVDYIATSFEEAQVLDSIRLALSRNRSGDEPGSTKRLGPARVLVADSNMDTVKWLKDALEASGYEVTRAFNSQQAVDMAVTVGPDLVLVNPDMPAVDGKPIVTQLCRAAGSPIVPIMLITDRVAPPKDSRRVQVLGRNEQVALELSTPVEVVVAEMKELIGAGVSYE